MLRWDEMYAYATRHDAPWPIEPTLGAAFEAFSAVANKTAEVLRCHFVGYAFVPLDTPYYGGRCAVGPFGQPKGATTANYAPYIPYLQWLKNQFAWRNFTRKDGDYHTPGPDAWCQPGYNSGPSPACWQNCSQVFACGNMCDNAAYCRGQTPTDAEAGGGSNDRSSPARKRAITRSNTVDG